jgi:quercetin dioxygenase-like cupin family protein
MRRMDVVPSCFLDGRGVPWERIGAVEGHQEGGELLVRVLQVGENILMLEVKRKQGQIDPPHQHDDHESCGYLITGRMRVVVDGKAFVAEAGSSWRHPAGIVHSSEALTDCHQIEIKSPPRKTWTTHQAE